MVPGKRVPPDEIPNKDIWAESDLCLRGITPLALRRSPPGFPSAPQAPPLPTTARPLNPPPRPRFFRPRRRHRLALRRTPANTGQPSDNRERLTGAIWGHLRGYVFQAFRRIYATSGWVMGLELIQAETFFNYFGNFKSFGGKGLRQKCPFPVLYPCLISCRLGLAQAE